MNSYILPLLLALLSGADPGSLRPAAVLTSASTPRVVHLAAPGVPAVSLRLSIPLREGPEEAGIGLVLRELSRDRLEQILRPVGALFTAERTPGGLVYTVTGSARHLDLLLQALSEAASRPAPRRLELLRARSAARTAASRVAETPHGALVAGLRDRLLPTLPPLTGTEEVLDTLGPAALEAFWARSHAPERMTVVVAGDVDPRDVARALRGVGSPPDRAANPPEGERQRPRARAETLRYWYGQAWLAGSPEDPRAAVASALASPRIRDAQGRGMELGVEVWEVGGRSVLVVAGAAYPSDAAVIRGRVSGLLPELEESLEEADVGAAVERVRSDLLIRARTPEGAAAVVGRALDSTGDPEAAWRFLEALDRVDDDAMEDFLGEMLSSTPLRHEVRP